MDDVVSAPPQTHDRPLLRRRNSNPDAPAKLTIIPHHNCSSTPTTSPSSDDLELLSIKPASHSYTSLKDLLPLVAVDSPKSSSVFQAPSGSDICIRNRLVKQAAWAYLQPMSTSPCSDGGSFLHRLWPRVAAFFDFVCRNVIRAFDWMLRAFPSSR